jgi:hypothetical protein
MKLGRHSTVTRSQGEELWRRYKSAESMFGIAQVLGQRATNLDNRFACDAAGDGADRNRVLGCACVASHLLGAQGRSTDGSTSTWSSLNGSEGSFGPSGLRSTHLPPVPPFCRLIFFEER